MNLLKVGTVDIELIDDRDHPVFRAKSARVNGREVELVEIRAAARGAVIATVRVDHDRVIISADGIHLDGVAVLASAIGGVVLAEDGGVIVKLFATSIRTVVEP